MDQRGANTSHAGSRQRLGSHVARLLRGSWREQAVSSQKSAVRPVLSEAELTEITPLLCHLGAGALAWRQLRDTALASCPAAHKLREIYRRHRLSALLHEREIAQVLTLLSAAGIEPVLIKGWAIARRYPDCALRPYGDVDLCVRPDQYDQATRMLRRIASIEGPFVDLHSGFTGVGQVKVQGPKSKVQSLSAVRRLWTEDGDDWDELYERSQLVQCPKSKVQSRATNVDTQLTVGSADPPPADRLAVKDSSRGLSAGRDTTGSDRINGSDREGVKEDFGPWTLDVGLSVPVRVLSDEDHLRILCRHLLRSGAHRPPWLCDVALLIEQVQSPVNQVQSPKSKVQSPTANVETQPTTGTAGVSPADREAVKDSSRGLSALRDTRGSDRINGSDPEGVKEDFRLGTLDPGPWTLDSGFDWNICLGRNALDANWIGTVVGLAHELLGANIDKTPFANRQLPAWLVPAVLDQWGGKRVQSRKSKVQSLLTADRPWTLDLGPWTNLYHRWDNPIRATAAVGGRFDDRSRIPYRLLESAMRISGQ